MKNLDWFDARALARKGEAIRRDAWRKWLVRELALSFISRTDTDGTALYYVVPASEFGAAEFLAADWTDEPWDTTLPPPVGYDSTGSTSTDSTGSAGSTSGDSSGGLVSSGSGTWGGAANPPDKLSQFQYSGGGTGPGGGTKGPPDAPRPNNPPTAQAPVVTVEIQQPAASAYGSDFAVNGACFSSGSTSPRTLSELICNVTIAGGPAGVGTLSVQLGGGTPQLGTGWPGMSQGFAFSGVSFLPHSTITITATYRINGSDYTGSGTFTFPDWCNPPIRTVAVSGISLCSPHSFTEADANQTFVCTGDPDDGWSYDSGGGVGNSIVVSVGRKLGGSRWFVLVQGSDTFGYCLFYAEAATLAALAGPLSNAGGTCGSTSPAGLAVAGTGGTVSVT